MPSTIPASTACEPVTLSAGLTATYEQMIRGQIPNLLRVYLNPYVTQACYCLARYAETNWPVDSEDDKRQVFLSNSFEEALSGAIKLARYDCNQTGRPGKGLIVDEHLRLAHFASTRLPEGRRLDYLRDVEVVEDCQSAEEYSSHNAADIGFVVVFHSEWNSLEHPVRQLFAGEELENDRPLLIVCTDQSQAASGSSKELRNANRLIPDIVVFDESFVNFELPFGAFAATRQLYRHWNRRGMATFHSTTYQPNTISSLHLMNCLRRNDPRFIERHQSTLHRIMDNEQYRLAAFRKRYSRSLAKLVTMVGFHQVELKTNGHYIESQENRIFDGVGGVACSVRGHNPATYLTELSQTGEIEDCLQEVSTRLEELTGLPKTIPAVSGASAVEQALKLGLASQSPRDYVLALRGGFGGKTLFALTGTWQSKLKVGLDPLYSKVVYVDPFAADAPEALEDAFRKYPIGVAQCELIQGVGGVRAIPENVLECLIELRSRYDCLLFVDEVQTGVFRTGPFVRSAALNLQPDLLTIGKGASDMMFPIGMTLCSEDIRQRLDSRKCAFIETYRSRYGYEFGYRTLLSTLRRTESMNLEDSVRKKGLLFAQLLSAQLDSCPNIRQIRAFGLLIGIELKLSKISWTWLKRLIPKLYLLGMLRHQEFPLLMGFCQYEPHVLKLTPPLSVDDGEIRSICETIGSVLRTSPSKMAARHLVQSIPSRRFA